MQKEHYEIVKTRLHELKFSQPFPLEATALVDALTQELIRYCQSYQQTKKQLQKRDRPPPGKQPLEQQVIKLEKDLFSRDVTINELKKTVAKLQARKGPSEDHGAIVARLQERVQQKQKEVSELREKLQVIRDYEDRFEDMQEQIEVLRFQNGKYADRLRGLQTQLEVSQNGLSQTIELRTGRDSQDKVNDLEERVLAKDRELEELLRQVGGLKGREVESQGLIRELSMKVEHLSHQAGRLQQQKSELQMLLSSRAKSMRQMERSLTELRMQAQEGEAYRTKYAELVERRVETESTEQNQAMAQVSRVKCLQHEVSTMADELKKVVQQNQEYRQQNKKLIEKEGAMRALIEQGSRKLEEAELQKHTLLEEIRVLRLRPSEADSQPQDKHQKRLSSVQNEEIKNLRFQLESERHSSETQKKSMKEMAAEVGRLHVQYEQAEKERARLEKFLEETQRINSQQSMRLQEEVKRGEALGRERNQALQQCEFLKGLNKQLNKEVDQKTASVLALDKERDDIQNEVDAKTEENARLLQQVSLFAQQNSRLKSLLAQAERLAQDYWKRLQRAESIAGELQRKREILVDEKQNFRSKSMAKDKQILQLGSDNNLFMREIQELKNSLNVIDIERNRLREENLGLVAELKDCAQQLQSLESQRGQAVLALQEAQRANHELFVNVQEFEIQNQKLGKYTEGLESQLAYFKTVVAGDLQKKETQLLNSVGQLERRLARAASRAGDLQKINSVLNEQKRRLQDQFAQFKKMVSMRQSQDLRGKQQIDLGKVELESTLERQRSELEVARAMLEGERSKVRQLEQILKGQRKKMAEMARSIEGRQPARGEHPQPRAREALVQRQTLQQESLTSENSDCVYEGVLRIEQEYQKIMQGRKPTSASRKYQ